jgi:CheY-like chemotaxis protein
LSGTTFGLLFCLLVAAPFLILKLDYPILIAAKTTTVPMKLKMIPQTIDLQALDLPRSMRILLLEDNDINRELLREYLDCLGYQVCCLPDGSKFFQVLSSFQPNLILLDLKLPGIDGFTLLEQVQKSNDWQHIPIIVVSAFAFHSDQQRALNLGAKRYFVKPVRLPHLKQAIQEELLSC